MNLGKFNPVIKEVNGEIQRSLQGEPERLYEAARHLPGTGGKRVRPILCLLSCQAVGGEPNKAIKAAAAIELVHTFTLIHDDIMDRDDMRRGVPSVHEAYGEPTAILAGDLLFSKAFQLCDPAVYRILAKVSAEVCEGQEMDMSFEGRLDVSEKEYLEMIRKKTAALIEAATKSGAILGGGSEEDIRLLADCGLNAGMAFQVHDDILGITGDEKKLGKPVGSDVVEGKKNIIAIKALEFSEGDDRKTLKEILGGEDKTGEDIETAIRIFNESRALDYAREMGERYIQSARKSIEKLPESEAREDLLEIGDFIIKRML